MARPRFDRIVDGDGLGQRAAIDLRAHRPAHAANDNGLAQARNLNALWPVVVALLVLVWAVLSVFS